MLSLPEMNLTPVISYPIYELTNRFRSDHASVTHATHSERATLLNSLSFVFKTSFLPYHRVTYDYCKVVQWDVIGVYRWILPKFYLSLSHNGIHLSVLFISAEYAHSMQQYLARWKTSKSTAENGNHLILPMSLTHIKPSLRTICKRDHT